MTAIVADDAPQHMQALGRANEVRLARAELRRQVAGGETTVQEIIHCVPWEAETMTVFDLLLAQHRWGRSRVRRLLGQENLAERKQIGALTERQRKSLLDRLNGVPTQPVEALAPPAAPAPRVETPTPPTRAAKPEPPAPPATPEPIPGRQPGRARSHDHSIHARSLATAQFYRP
jgi:hypothetical protein